MSVDEALRLAMALHQQNDRGEAEDIYRAVLEQAPDHPDALHFFGLLRHELGHSKEAVELISKAIEAVPDYRDAHNNLGNIYLQTGRDELAERCFRRVLELDPDFAPAHGNLGVALKNLRRYDEAIAVLFKAIELAPRVSHHYQNLANVFRKRGDYDDAIRAYCKVLSLKPYDAEAYKNLARTFYLMGEGEKGVEVLRQWLAVDPANPIAQHLYCAYSGDATPNRASDDYVQQTFDRFADSFDTVLEGLGYQAPRLVADALRAACKGSRLERLLDLGCGTGLCGPLVRPLTRRLVGIDLSPKMLDRAGARGIYDELEEAELSAYLATDKNVYDALISADTLCYFGELPPLFQAATGALKQGGWFVFTLERLDPTPDRPDFRLNLHGRYSHSEEYLTRSLADSGFDSVSIRTVELRKELDNPVVGLLITARSDGNRNPKTP
jgi:predicted TPR repeat methyltransferase